jgi:hypothetical protein
VDSNPIKYPIVSFFSEEFRVKNRLRNRRLYRHQSYQLHHEMFLLRARLLHAVNAVNNFVLTTVCNRILKFCFLIFLYFSFIQLVKNLLTNILINP